MQKKKKEAAVMSDLALPEDIQVEILMRMPVHSILTCKCVCKSWRSLICNPDFTKNYLNHGIQTNNHRLLVNYYNYNSSVERIRSYTSGFASISLTSSHSDGYTSEDYPLQDMTIEEADWVKILGSSNGLICLCIVNSPEDTRDEKYAICIWNPSTREYKKLPMFKKSTDDFTRFDFCNAVYGFGYDGVKDDYKLVRMDDSERPRHFNIQVYTLRSDSWCDVRDMPYWFPSHCKCDGSVFNGSLHWFGVAHETSIEVIVSLNLSNESIVEIPLPEAPLPHPIHEKVYQNVGVNVGVLEDCLCLVLNDESWKTIDVWAMKDYGVKESWTKQVTIIRANCTPFYCYHLWKPIWTFKNGDILANNTEYSYHSVESTRQSLIIRNPEEVWSRKVYISENQKVLESVSYIESLVSLNSGTYVGKRIPIIETHPAPDIKRPGNFERILTFIEKLITAVFYS